MSGHRNDNLATLLEPDCEDVVEELRERFKKGILFVNFGDGIIALNPQTSQNRHINSPESGKRYCSKRFISNLPAHVYALAHNVYKDATSPKSQFEAHSILVSGFAGSGKTEISEMLIAQFLREARVSRWNDIPFVLMKGLVALKRLLTCKSTSGPTSSNASMVVTLYFGQDGNCKTAKIALHLLNSRHAIPHTQDRGYLNIFCDLVAALRNAAPGLSPIENIHIILQGMDPALTQMTHETLVDHRNHWLDFIEIIRDLNIGENVPLGRQGNANSFLDSLLGLLLLATTQFDIDQHTKQYYLRSKDSFATAAQLLGVPASALYNAVIVKQTDDLPQVNAVQSRDQLVHELYSRLVTWLIGEINSKFPVVESGDIPVHVADLQPFLDHPTGSLEDLCHNMAAEYIQMLQNKAVFARENDACKAEGLKVPVVKRQRCEDIVELAFKTPGGLLHQLETSCDDLTLTDKVLVKSLNTNFKKRKDLYVGTKASSSGLFAIVHSHKQVEYHVDPLFRHQNLIIPNREAQKLLTTSGNVTVKDAFKQAIKELSSPNMKSHSYVTYIRAQINALRDQLFGAVPHLVRCIKPLSVSSEFDANFLKSQVQSACLPDIIQRKRSGYSHWMTIPDFLRRYKMLDLSLLSRATKPEEACKSVLKRVGILGKGPAITKNYVFLGYWHKEELDASADAFVWKVTLVQAWFRGHLTRRRLQEVIVARLRFRDDVSSFRNDSSSRISRGQMQYDEAEENALFERMIANTLTRVNTLSSSTWAKVIYMEQRREVANVYAAELSLFVTGSYHPFNGFELGLGHFNTPHRLEESEYIVRNIDQGIELRRDSDGSLLVKRCCQLPVCVKHLHSQPGLSADMLRMRGELPLGHFLKIFDMGEFYSLVSLEMKKPNFSIASLQKSCITMIRFGSSHHHQFLRMPCWMAVININALNVLNDAQELQSISLMASQLILIKDKEDDETKIEQEEAKTRRQRKHWSKSDQRPQLKKREANSRNIRKELRKRGETISDHMKYSWEEDFVSKAGILSMDQLYERMRGQSSETSSSSQGFAGQSTPVKNWAKVNVALRDAFRELQRTEVEDTITTER